MLLKKLDSAIREFFCLFLVRVDELLMFLTVFYPKKTFSRFKAIHFLANAPLMGMVHPKTRFNSK